MAYENMTYEEILTRMMSRVTANYPNLDTREGSILFNALAPAALELAIAYSELDNVLNESFVGTASREYLFKACEQVGLDTSVFDASPAEFHAEFNVEVSIGSRWNYDIYNYTVVEYKGFDSNTLYHKYRLVCETEGTAPNDKLGDLSAITELPYDLTYARLTKCIVPGENESSDEEIRTVYFNHINSSISGGSVSQYEAWCETYDGIGHYKVIPQWDGVNTVKVIILDTSGGLASDDLVEAFQKYLDPKNSKGMGNGVAPIGSVVTVTTATETTINVSATVVGNYSKDDLTKALENYFGSIAFTRTSVPYMNVGAVLLEVPGVESISNLKLNNGTSDISLSNEAIPVLGTTTWS